MSTAWKTVRVFLSSTFRDMHAERDHLLKVTFPRLRQWCEERRLHLVDIDLRWGVTKEQADDGRALEICLDEIDGSRPFFVCFLGNRYGWVPPPEQVAPDALARFPGARERAHCSITHLEIIHAVEVPLDTGDRSRCCPHAFFYLRDPNCLPAPTALANLGHEQRETYQRTFFEQDAEAVTALVRLKESLRQRFAAPGRIFDYAGVWDANADNPEDDSLKGRLTRLDAFGDRVESDLRQAIATQFADHIAALARRDPLAEERSLHEAFLENRTRIHVPRTETERTIDRHLAGNDSRPLIVSGGPGSGKSALLAHWVRERNARPDAGFILARFLGASPASTDLHRLLTNLSQELCQHFSLTEEVEEEFKNPQNGQTEKRKIVRAMAVPDEPTALRLKWPTVLQQAGARGRVVLVLDALNQMERSADPRRLDWLPLRLPAGVCVVASVLDHGSDAAPEDWLACLRRQGYAELPVPPLSDADRRRIIRELPSVFCKTLDDSQVSLLLHNAATRNPLFLTVALEELRVFGSFEKLPEAIGNLPRLSDRGVAGSFERVVEEMFGRVLDRLVRETRSTPGLVPVLFQLLASAREGLSEQELDDLLARKLPRLEAGQRRGATQSVLRQVRLYLMRKGRQQAALVDFYHRSFWKAVRARYLASAAVRRERHRDLAAYFGGQPNCLAGDAPNDRRLIELPWQLLQAAREGEHDDWTALERLLCDLSFVEAKCLAGMVHELQGDYEAALADWPGHSPRDPWARPAPPRVPAWQTECVQAVLAGRANVHPSRGSGPVLARLLGRRSPADDLLEVLPAEDVVEALPWEEESDPARNVEAFASFVTAYGHVLRAHPEATLATARNHADGGPVADSAGPLTVGMTRPWIEQEPRPPAPPRRPVCVRVLEGHTGEIKTVALSADGRIAVTAEEYSSDPTHIWDLTTGQKLRTIPGNKCVALTPDAAVAVLGAASCSVVVVEPGTGQVLCDFRRQGGDRDVRVLAVTPDGKLAVSGGEDRMVRIWDPSGRGAPRVLEGHTDWVETVAVTPDGRLALSGSHDKTVRLWDLTAGKCLQIWREHTDWVRSVALTSDGRTAITLAGDGLLHVRDVVTGRIRRTLHAPEKLYRATLVRDGTQVLTRAGDDCFIFWDLDSGRRLRTISGCHGAGTTFAVTPDGTLAVTADKNGLARVWDLVTGEPIQPLSQYRGHALPLAASPDSRLFLSPDGNKVDVWEATTGRTVQTLNSFPEPVKMALVTSDGRHALTSDREETVRVWRIGADGPIQGVGKSLPLAVSPDGSFAVSEEGRALHLWDLADGRMLATLQGFAEADHVRLTPDGGTAVVLMHFGDGIQVWDLGRGRSRHTFRGHSAFWGIDAVALAERGGRALSSDDDLHLWDLKSGQYLAELEGHDGSVTALAVSADGRVAVSGGRDNTVRLWDAVSGRCLRTLEGHTSGIEAVAMTPDGRRAVSASSAGDSSLRIWDLDTGRCLRRIEKDVCCPKTVALSADGRLAVCNAMEYVQVWDLERGRLVRELKGHSKDVTAVALTPDGKTVVSAGDDGLVIVWDLGGNRKPQGMKEYTDAIRCVAITPDGRQVFSGSKDRCLIAWDVAGKRCLRLKDNSGPVTALSLDAGGERLLVGAGEMFIWDVRRQEVVQRFEGHTSRVNDAAVTPDGCCAVSAGEEPALRIWDLVKGECLRVLPGRRDFKYVAVTADGRRAVSADDGHALHVWDLITGKCLHALEGHTNKVRSIVGTPDGRYFLSSSDDGTVRAWELESGRCLLVHYIGEALRDLSPPHPSGTLTVSREAGGLLLLNLRNVPQAPPLTTAVRFCHPDGPIDTTVTSGCPWCAGRFPVPAALLEAIAQLGQTAGPNPCLTLPVTAWQDARLRDACPRCGKPLRFNPFVASVLGDRWTPGRKRQRQEVDAAPFPDFRGHPGRSGGA